ncbi:MAG: DDE-type integrase/transposase/recombinase [Christensenellaceae bacterium]|jgi:transposase-like protein/transposase InsO family protein|nr:DDE-type integrase/transposase/recombinase [Christensenellaceae bacterium]
MKRTKYSAKDKQRALNMLIEEKINWKDVCKEFNCTRMSLFRWKKIYDGTLNSLENHSSRPKTPHPKQQTQEEIDLIINTYEENKTLGLTEIWNILRKDHGYSRHFLTMYKIIKKKYFINTAKKKTPVEDKTYHESKTMGMKMQMDVKYIKDTCYLGSDKSIKFYQYTMIDEATRERFIYPYTSKTANSTLDFINRALNYYKYTPKIIQTDNGKEFTNFLNTKTDKIHKVDELLNSLNIKHMLIKPQTPWHNGKVERSHRTDESLFYKYLTFHTLDELETKMNLWLCRYNAMPSTSIRNCAGKRVYQSPIEKRLELIELLKNSDQEQK